jgi:outer membrane protein W
MKTYQIFYKNLISHSKITSGAKNLFALATTMLTLSISISAFINIISLPAQAGVVEVSVGGSSRKQNFDTETWDETSAYTGSLSYYFSEMSSVELSYTDAFNRRVAGNGSLNEQLALTTFKAAGLDFIYTHGGRDAQVRPYVKAGPMYIIEKKTTSQYKVAGVPYSPNPVDSDKGLVPSAGIGIRIAITSGISLKLGYDIWMARPFGAKDATGNAYPNIFDTAGRAALSWAF